MSIKQRLNTASRSYKVPAAKKVQGRSALLDFTFLTGYQIWGVANGIGQLDVLKKYGTSVAPTDLTVLLGGYVTSGSNNRTSEGDLACVSWSASSASTTANVYCVDYNGGKEWFLPCRRSFSARPVLPPSNVSKIGPIETKGEVSGCQVVEYGEYPQTVADDHIGKKLERLHKSKSLHPTGKKYTFDSVALEDTKTSFKVKSYLEYELDGKRYIRILSRPADRDSRLSTGEQVEKGKPYWVEVQPIEWLMDPSGTMVAKKCLFAGIQFDTKEDYDGDFSKTSMKDYLDTYFAKEMESERPKEREKRLKREETIKGIKAKLAEAIDPEKVKATVGFTRTDSRREIAEAIKTTRRARDVFIAAGKKAQKEGDQELINQIVEMADFYVRSDQAQRRAAHQRRAEYRAQRAANKKDGGR